MGGFRAEETSRLRMKEKSKSCELCPQEKILYQILVTKKMRSFVLQKSLKKEANDPLQNAQESSKGGLDFLM